MDAPGQPEKDQALLPYLLATHARQGQYSQISPLPDDTRTVQAFLPFTVVSAHRFRR